MEWSDNKAPWVDFACAIIRSGEVPDGFGQGTYEDRVAAAADRMLAQLKQRFPDPVVPEYIKALGRGMI